jgi:hypothetical protein
MRAGAVNGDDESEDEDLPPPSVPSSSSSMGPAYSFLGDMQHSGVNFMTNSSEWGSSSTSDWNNISSLLQEVSLIIRS